MCHISRVTCHDQSPCFLHIATPWVDCANQLELMWHTHAHAWHNVCTHLLFRASLCTLCFDQTPHLQCLLEDNNLHTTHLDFVGIVSCLGTWCSNLRYTISPWCPHPTLHHIHHIDNPQCSHQSWWQTLLKVDHNHKCLAQRGVLEHPIPRVVVGAVRW